MLGSRHANALRAAVFALLLALLLSFAAIELRSLDNGFVADDYEHLYVASTTSTSPAGILKMLDVASARHYRPVHWMSTLVLYNAFGLTPAPFHLLSVLIDLANAVLAGLLVWRLARSVAGRQAGWARWTALAVAVLFWFSLRNHEAVFWYGAINEVLALFFRLIALHLALSWLRGEKRPLAAYLGALLAALLALGSKETGVVLPAEMAALFTFEIIGSGKARRPLARRAVAAVVPFAILAVAWLTMYTLSTPVAVSGPVPRAATQLISAGAGTWVLRLLQHLNGVWLPIGWLSRHPALLVLEFGTLLVVVAAAVRRRRWLWLLGLAWMIISVMPYVAIRYGVTSPEDQAVLLTLGGDRYQYSAAFGGAIVLIESAVWLVEDVLRRLPSRLYAVSVAAVVASLLLYGSLGVAVRSVREAQWDTAGRIATRVLKDVRTLVPSAEDNMLFCFDQLPKTYGNYAVFFTDVRYALYVTYGRDDLAVRAAYYPAPWEGASPPLDTEGCPVVLRVDPKTGTVSAR